MSGCVVEAEELKFKAPFGMVVSGPSSSGKSTWVLKFLAHATELISPPPAQILYAYGEYHKHVPMLEKAGVVTHAGLPSDEVLAACEKPFLLVLDDLMLASSEQYLSELYTKKSHHRNISVVTLVQDLFAKHLKVARINSQYVILMNAPNAALSVRTLGSQLFPGRVAYFLDAYRKATERKYGYLVIDMHASASPTFRLRTDIFPDEHTVIFMP